jgi:hypothetical protein
MQLKTIRAESASSKAAKLLIDCKLQHEAVGIENPNALTGQKTEMISKRTVSNLFDPLQVDGMKRAQSLNSLVRVDLGGEAKGNSHEKMVGMDVEGKSALDELALKRMHQVSSKKDRHLSDKRGGYVFGGLVLVNVADRLQEHVRVWIGQLRK